MQELSNEEYLTMKYYSRIKFFNESDEKERLKQTIQPIIGRFDSDALGFVSSSDYLFPNDIPIQRFEDICIIYDIEELSKLEEVIKLKDFLT